MILSNPGKNESKKRRDCLDGERPCPWIRCRHHMVWFVPGIHKKSDEEILELIFSLPETCTLDVADRGGQTLETIANLFGISRERVRQIENHKGKEKGAIQKLRHQTENETLASLREFLAE